VVRRRMPPDLIATSSSITAHHAGYSVPAKRTSQNFSTVEKNEKFIAKNCSNELFSQFRTSLLFPAKVGCVCPMIIIIGNTYVVVVPVLQRVTKRNRSPWRHQRLSDLTFFIVDRGSFYCAKCSRPPHPHQSTITFNQQGLGI